jgi:hypothetical protein
VFLISQVIFKLRVVSGGVPSRVESIHQFHTPGPATFASSPRTPSGWEIVRQLGGMTEILIGPCALRRVARLRAARNASAKPKTVKKVLEDAQGTLRTEDVEPGG